MATTGSTSVVVTSWDTLRFTWTLESQSVANNTSVVSWALQLIAGSDGYINSTASKAWSVTVNGTTYSGSNTVGIANNATKTLASGKTTIVHNADGSKSFSYSFSQEFGITFQGSSIGTKTGSGSGELTTISRKSTLTASNGTLGVSQTLTVNRAASSFTHTIRYQIGESYWTIVSRSSETRISWTPPIERASLNTVGTVIQARLTIDTYSGDNLIGTASTNIRLSIPASVRPSCSVEVTDPTGHKDTYGYFVRGLSRCRVVTTGVSSYGSPIASYVGYINGAKYSHQDFNVEVPASNGTLAVEVTVKDKRGRIGSWSGTYNVLEYVKPNISALSVYRCLEDGTEDDQGEYVKVVFSAAVAALRDRNTARYTLRYKATTASSFVEVALTDLTGVYSVTNAERVFAASSDSSYDVEIVAADNHDTTRRATTASTAFTLLNFHPSGKGMAIGQVAERPDVFALGLPLVLNQGIAEVAADKAAATRAALGFKRHLWGTAEWSAANSTINVPGLQDYTLFILKVTGTSVNILATRVGSNFRGIGGYAMDSGQRVYGISAVISNSTTLSLTLCNYVQHTPGGNHAAAVAASISDIWGVI